MTVCILCALEAFVAGEGDASKWSFDESSEAHTARVHPDPAARQARRVVLERDAAARIQRGEAFRL